MRKVMIALALVGASGPVTAQGVSTKTTTVDYEFGYSYPAAAARIPGMKSWLEAEKARKDSAGRSRRAARGGKVRLSLSPLFL